MPNWQIDPSSNWQRPQRMSWRPRYAPLHTRADQSAIRCLAPRLSARDQGRTRP